MNANNNLPILPYPGDQALIEQLEQATSSIVFRLWEEPETCVVLGKSNKVEQELQLETIVAEQIPVYRREGGGGSVVLAPGMLILAVAMHVTDIFGSKRFFQLIQTPIQEALLSVGIPDVRQLGISDLASGERKILGSSMRRKRTMLLYQSVLLVDIERTMFGRLLQHPPKEPDYRKGRSHDSFTVCLRELGYKGSLSELKDVIEKHFATRLPLLLRDELVS